MFTPPCVLIMIMSGITMITIMMMMLITRLMLVIIGVMTLIMKTVRITITDMRWCELNPSLVLWAPLCSKLGEKFHITSRQVIHSTIMKSCSHLQMLINLFHATNTQHTAQEFFFFFKLGVNFLRTVTLIDNHVTTAYNNTNNVTMSLHTRMQNVTTDIKFLAYEHALAISAAAQVLCLQVSLRSWAK